MPLSLAEFVERWKAVTLTERAAALSGFNRLNVREGACVVE
jgi:hypothetical protein